MRVKDIKNIKTKAVLERHLGRTEIHWLEGTSKHIIATVEDAEIYTYVVDEKLLVLCLATTAIKTAFLAGTETHETQKQYILDQYPKLMNWQTWMRKKNKASKMT